MLNDFYHAAIPEPVTLLGLRLRPLSLGHMLLLHRVESAFVTGGMVSFDDLCLSVFICAQPYAAALNAFNDTSLPRFMRRWYQKLTGDVWWRRLLRFKVRPVDLLEKSNAFARYMEAGSKAPYFDYPEGGEGSKIETVHAVQLALLAKTSLTEAEILDRPWGRCLHDYVALLAMEDKITIRDKSVIQEAQEIGRRVAEKMKARNGAVHPDS